MANSIEIPVSLGLQTAQSQAEALRKILEQSVQPNSTAFKEISNLIAKAVTQAEKLKAVMGESFKTSSGSKKFQNDMQKTFDILTTAMGRLQNVNSRDLILSEADQTRITTINAEMEKLQGEITTLQSGKIGSFFEAHTEDEFKNIQELASSFTKNLSNMTFSGLSERLSKELDTVQDDLSKTKKQMEDLQKQQSSLNIEQDKTSFINSLVKETQRATKFSGSSAEDLKKQMRALFEQYKSFFEDDNFNIGATGKGTSFSNALENQLKAAEDSFKPRIENITKEIEKYQNALSKLDNIKIRGFNGGREADASSKALKQAALDAGLTDVRDRQSGEWVSNYAAYIKQQLNEAWNKAIEDQQTTIQVRESLKSQISQAFEGIGEANVVGTGFKSIIKTWLKSSGIDTSAPEIEQALNQMLENVKVEDALGQLSEKLQQYFTRILQETDTTANGAEEKIRILKNAIQALDDVIGANATELTDKQQKYEGLADALQEFNEETEKSHKAKIDNLPKPQEYDQATDALNKYIASLSGLESKQKALSNVQNAVTHWMGFYQVLNLGKRAIQDMKTHIQELDTVMTQIAVVTNMSQEDLWGQIGKYSQIARQYGVAIKGVYEVSQIYYQQGLNQGDVMNLTTETLKMARIAGLDYATAADYMTTAIRGFKLEMTDAAHVTDVYSALAAKTASSTEELAVAISKTASSAEAVGSSFEATSAMMATMISVTRESATNIGTALKSVISRYGEMTSDPSKLVDSKGEEMSLNRVDAALKTIGITIQDVNGQFRDFDDVILELGEKWDTLDKNSQRYIATLMAGNRQQSRFLSLVGNIDEYKNALEIAQNSEGAGELQTLKTLDSIDARIEKMKVTIQEFYTSSGLEKVYKGILDTITNIVSAANDMPKLFTNIPATAIAVGFQLINTIKNILKLIIATIQVGIENFKTNTNTALGNIIVDSAKQGAEAGKAWRTNFEAEMNKLNANKITGVKAFFQTSLGKTAGMFASAAFSALGAGLTIAGTNKYGASKTDNEDRAAGRLTLGGAIGNAISGGISGFMMSGSPLIAAVSAIASGLPSLISGLNMLDVSLTRQIELSDKRVSEAKQNATEKRGQYSELNQAYIKLEQLKEASTESAEAMNEYKEYMNQLADSYPELVSQIQANGDAIISLTDLEEALAQARLNSAQATVEQLEAEQDNLEKRKERAKKAQDIALSIGAVPRGERQQLAYQLETLIGDTYKANGNELAEDLNTRIAELAEFAVEIYGDIENFKEINTKEDFQGVANAVEAYQKEFGARYITDQLYQLQNAVNQVIKADSSLTVKNLLGFDLQSTDDYLNLSFEQYLQAVEHFQNKTKDLVDVTTESLNQTNDALTSAMLDIGINEFLNTNTKTRASLSKYISLFSYLFSGRYGDNVDWKSDDYQEKLTSGMQELTKWATDNLDLLSDLMNLDVTKFSSTKNLKSTLTQVYNLNDEWQEGFLNEYAQAMLDFRTEIGTAFRGAKVSKDFLKVAGPLFATDAIPIEYKTLILNTIKQYKDLQKEGLVIAAQNLENNLLSLLQLTADFSDEEKDLAIPIIKSIDLTDYDSITKGIEQLQELPQSNKIFGSLINFLQTAANQITGNAAIWAQQLINSTKKFAESTEKFFGKLGKGMEYSEAFEIVQDIIKSSEKDYSFDDLVDFDNELGGYVLNRTAIYESLEKLNKDRQKNIEKANDDLIKIQAATEIAKKITEIESEGKTPEKIVNEITTKEKLPDGGQLLESIIKQWQDSGQELDKFLDDYNKEQSTKADFQIKEAEMALEKLGLKLAGSLDFSVIADGTASESTVKNMLAAAMKAKFPNAANGLINRWVDTIYSQLKEGNFKIFESVFGKGIVSDKTKTDAVKANLQQYHTAISEVLNATTDTLSQATKDLLKDNGYNQNITKAVEAVSIALQLYQKTTYETLEEANEQYAEILQKSLDTSGKDYQAIDFLSGAITIDSFKNLANNFGEELETWFNIEGQDAQTAIEQAFDGALAYNKLTGEFDIVGTIDDVINKVRKITGTAIEANTIEYLELYESLLSSRNAKTIKQQQRIDGTAIREATKNITFTGKGQFASLDAIESLATALHLDVNSLIGNYIAELDAYSLKADLTQLDLDKIDGVKEIIAESINAFIASLVDLVSKGISGSLSQADVSNLKGNLGQLGLDELAENLDFTKTTEGLQLSQASAIQLYNEIKKIDRLQGEVVFKELSQTLTDSNEKFKSSTSLLAHIKDLEKAIADENQRISAADGKVSDARLNQYNAELAVAKEILAVRSTSEDSSFNFMSNDIPGGQKNPINYISNWSKALKILQDASGKITKGPKGELGGGFVSYQDWYNIATEMDNMAIKAGNRFEFAGITLGDGMSHASELINKGIAALSVNTSTGELEVSLGKMGISFDAAASDLNTNVQDGIKGIAEAEVNMLDSMISVLETIVAMEQLGDIDTDNDMTIELPEIVVEEGGYDVDGKLTDGKGFSEAFNKWRQDILEKINGTDIAYADMRTAFEKVVINGKTLRQVIDQSASKFTDIDAKMLTALYQASKSGNYDLDNIWQSVKETLAGIEGFEGQIDVGDMHLAISNGIVLEAEGGKYIVGGLKFDYSQYQEACRAAMLEKIGAKGKFIKVEGDNLGEVEYQGYLNVGSEQIKVQTEGKNVKYLSNITGQSYDSIDQLISAERDKLVGSGQLSTDTTTLEYAYSVGYKVAPEFTGVDTSNISQTQINSLVGKSLKDLQDAAKDAATFEATFGFKFDSSMTEEQLTELKAKLGIENKAIEMTISANAPTGEGADVLAQLMAEPEPSRTITVNTEIGTDNAKILGKTTLDPIPMDTLDVIVQTLQVILRSNPDMTEIDNVIQAIQNAGATPIEQLESLVKILAFVSGVTDLTALDNVVQAVKNGGAPSIEELQSFIELLSFISQKTDISNLTGEVKNVEDNWSTNNPVSPLTSYVSALFIQLAAGALNTKDLDNEVNKVKAPDTPPLTSYAKELLIQLVNKLPNMDEVNEVVDKITRAENIPELISIAEQLLIKKGWTEPTEDEGLVPTGIVLSNSSIETLAVLVEALKYINDGKLNIDEKDIKVPDQLSGEYDIKALIVQALLDWANGENYDLSNIIPENGQIDLGTYKGKIKIGEIEVENPNKNKDPVLKLYEERKTRQLTSEEFSAASKQAALQRNELRYSPISAEEYAASWSKYNSPLLDNMKEAIISGFNEGLQEINKSSSNNEIELSPTIQTDELESALKEAQNIYESFGYDFNNINISDFAYWLESIKNVEGTEISFDVDKAEEQLLAILDLIGEIPDDVKTTINAADKASGTLSKIASQLRSIPLSKVTTVTTKYVVSGNPSNNGARPNYKNDGIRVAGPNDAKGNTALAKGRKTLLGELGPELYVTNGHYYVAGQNGAEFIDLPDDAIVFNHLQTQRLLKNGSAGRGKAVTNEKKAISLATGNAQGPAMASAAAALAELKRIRAMWQSMLDASLSDLGQQAGGGGGGGGGKKKNTIDPGFIADLERWYNLLRQIDKLEKDINYQETLRNKLQSDRVARGWAIYDSQKKQLGQINDELVAHHQLATLQEDYYNKRRKVLNEETAYGAIFTFNEEGLMQYNDNAILGKGTQYESKGGLTALATLNAQNADGSPVLTAQQQYEMLKAWGFGADMVYDSSGKKIDFGEEEEDEEKRKEVEQAAYTTAVQAFWDKADGWKDELDELYDSYREQEESILELQAKRNEILQEIQDNQLAVEDKIYNAIVDSRQRQIDEAQKERDALEKSQTKFIDGLNKALTKERQMYENEQEAEDLNKMRRRLGILQRSGGSASSIRSLQEQITQKEKDAYFNAQQQQIDAIQEASDLEIERLDNQIELMTETLEYQKENGLLWEQVAQVMQGTPEQMAEFITANGNEWRNYSTEMFNKQKLELDKQLEQWHAYRTDESGYWEAQDGRLLSVQGAIRGTDDQPWAVYDKAMTELFGDDWAAIRESAKQYFDQALGKTGDDNEGKTAVQQSEEYQNMKADIEARKAQELENQKPITNDSSNSGSSGGGNGKSGSKSNENKNGTLRVTPYLTSGGSVPGYGPKDFSVRPNMYAGPSDAQYRITGYNMEYAVPTSVYVPGGQTVNISYYYKKIESEKSKGSDSNTKVNGNAKLAYLENNQKVQAPLDMDQTVYQPQKKWHIEESGLEFETEQLAKDYLKMQQERYATGDTDFAKKQREKWKNAKISQYEKGGLNDYTGLAMLHGTKQKPEGILNAEQTRILRNDILGGSNSLMSLLVDFKNAMAGTVTSNDYNNINNTSSDNPINIERVEVSVQSGVVSSDYDARRAGNMMSEGLKEEMIKISRKTGFQNNIRG